MKSNTKRKSSIGIGAALILMAMKCMAYIWVIISLLVLIVGGFMVVKLIGVAHEVLPDQTGRTNHATIYIDPPPPTNNQSQAVTPAVEQTGQQVMAQSDQQSAPSGFALQYGLSLPTSTNEGLVPWVFAGTKIPTTNSPMDIRGNIIPNVLVSSSGEYSFTFTINGYTFAIDMLPGNVDFEGLDNNWNLPTNTVVILRTTNMVTWTPIFTNSSCGINQVQTFIDPDPPLGPTAFYKTAYIGGPTNQP